MMNEVYKAIRDKLVLDLITSADIVKAVHDHVPQDLSESGYPFLRLDAIHSINNDVDDKSGFQATVQVVGYSRYRGSKEISNIADKVYNAIHRQAFLDTATYGMSGVEETFRKISVQPDGLTRNSVQQYEIFFETLI